MKNILNTFPAELSRNCKKIFETIYKKYSMVSEERLYNTLLSLNYVKKNNIQGDFVETGVWKGGNPMTAAFFFKKNKMKKNVFLFDTFEGMTKPLLIDKRPNKEKAIVRYNQLLKNNKSDWINVSLAEVKNNFQKNFILDKNIFFIKGKIEDTGRNLPSKLKKISILRIDTDFYESVYASLKYLFPLLVKNGVLIIDDYGYWKGAQKAVDEYFKKKKIKIFLNYIDHTGRCGIKN